jgi:glycosyltransferase involved in cell wall biosynthesis
MKVLQLMAGAAQGGAETFFVALAEAFQRAGLEQRTIIRQHPQRADRLRRAGVVVHEAAFGSWFDIGTRLAVRREIAAFQPDVALAWMGRAARFIPTGRHVGIGRLGGWYDLKRFRSCRHLVGNTPEIARWCVQQGWPEARTHYIPNFVAWRDMVAVQRATLETPAGVPVLLALGRLHANKAFDVAIRALAQVPDAILWLAGEGNLRADLARLADDAGVASRIRFLGWRDDKEALFAAADLCLVPSRVEPFGNVVLDAWASGTPLIAAAATGPAQFVRDGQDGLLVPVDDSAALAAAINRLLANQAFAKSLAHAGHARWQVEFTEEVCVANWLDLFRRVGT